MPDPFSFVRSRLDGRVSLRLMLWRDMAMMGTLINLLASFGALMLVAQGVGTGAALFVHFAPTPYNLFIVGAIWRAPVCRRRQAIAAGVWLILMTIA